jgi:hypothetical protein
METRLLTDRAGAQNRNLSPLEIGGGHGVVDADVEGREREVTVVEREREGEKGGG